MIFDFLAGDARWYIDTDKTYLRISEEKTGKIRKESHDLGQVCQLEDFRIAAYEGTYAMIGISDAVEQTGSQSLPPMVHDRLKVNLIWSNHTNQEEVDTPL